MSCGNPDSETAALMPRRLKFDRTRTCVKCKSNPGNLVIRHAVYCRDCFYPLVTTKFKRILEPTVNPIDNRTRRKALKAEGNLLLAFSGGLDSTVLLDLVSRCYFAPTDEDDENPRGGKNHPRNGNVWNKVYVCYVEVCNAFPGSRDRTEEIRAVVDRHEGFELIPLRIENAFDHSWWRTVGERQSRLKLSVGMADEDLLLSISSTPDDNNVDPVESLRSYLTSLPTQTAVSSTIQTLIRMLLLYTAFSTQCSHVLLGTSLTSLSVALISSVSQGAGFGVREEIEEQWMPTLNSNSGADITTGQQGSSSRQRCVRIVRPLREIGMKECAIWAWWNKLQVVGHDLLPGANQGIDGLTKSFIIGLEQNYPSTVSAIARTCGKLAPKEKVSGSCVLCQRPVPPGIQEWKARISIRSISSTATEAPAAREVPQSTDSHPLTPHLCYACHTTLTSRSSRGMSAISKTSLSAVAAGNVALPVWVQSSLHGSLVDSGSGDSLTQNLQDDEWNRAAMKATVSEYLLE